MRWLVGLIIAMTLSLAGPLAHAAEDLRYGPTPAWVKIVPPPLDLPNPGGSTQALLLNQQNYFGKDAVEAYYETASKVLSVDGLQELGTMVTAWDPASQVMMINKATIIRDGKEIDLLAGKDRFSVMRRETNLSQSVLDGNLTAILEIKDLRVGDVVRMGVSTVYTDPIRDHHAEVTQTLYYAEKIGRLVYRQVWDKSRPVRWRVTPQFGEVKLTETDLESELLLDRRDVVSPMPPAGAPARFDIPAYLELTEFKTWGDVAGVLAPLFNAASTLTPDSPLRAEVEKIKAAHKTPETQALAALQLVESQVRYYALLMGAGGLTPASADATWASRFGDCKAKTALLLALLRELGIHAQAAVVDADGGDGLDERLPQIQLFDHVIVRAEIGGKIYWLDGTRVGDRQLQSESGPPFIWALPLQTAALERPVRAVPERPLLEVLSEIDASGGIDAIAPVRRRIVLRGDEAINLERSTATLPREEGRAALLEKLHADAEMQVESLDFGWDEAVSGFVVDLVGKAKQEWYRAEGFIGLPVLSSFEPEYDDRSNAAGPPAPFAIAYPFHTLEVQRIRLPDNGAGFVLAGDDAEVSGGGLSVKRTSRIGKGEAVIETRIKALAPEISAADAAAAVKAFGASPLHEHVLIMAEANAVGGAQSELVRLALANIEAGSLEEAIPYLDRAIRLDKRDALALETRFSTLTDLGKFEAALVDARALAKLQPSLAHDAFVAATLAQLGRYRPALAASDAILKVHPDSSEAQIPRIVALAGLDRAAEMAQAMDSLINVYSAPLFLELSQHAIEIVAAKPERAIQQFARALTEQPQSPSARYFYGLMIVQEDRKLASAQFRQALLIRPDFHVALFAQIVAATDVEDFRATFPKIDSLVNLNPKEPLYLTQRGAVYVGLKELAKAAADFDAAVALAPDDAEILNSACYTRAMANFEVERGLAQCDEALRLQPNHAAFLDSRAFAYLRLGRYGEAIAEYDKALLQEAYALSFYGRGLAKRRTGDEAGARADLAKATSIAPTVSQQFAEYGLTP